MRFFIDTEFIECPNTIDLISIGIVSDTGREYSAISSEYNPASADEWVIVNVLGPLYRQQPDVVKSSTNVYNFHKMVGDSRQTIREEILSFIGTDEPTFWGYYSAYDWVAFCWLFGKMIDLPKGFPMYCRDIKQLMDQYGIEALPSPKGEHDALVDAKWNKQMYQHIIETAKIK